MESFPNNPNPDNVSKLSPNLESSPVTNVLPDVDSVQDFNLTSSDRTTEISPKQSFRQNIGELWAATKSDYKDASPKEKLLMKSALAFQVWNQARFQQAVTIPAAINVYISSGGNEVKAASFFAAANYVQNFAMSATGGGAMRKMHHSNEVIKQNYPKTVKAAKAVVPDEKSSYVGGLLKETITGQATGAMFPFVAGEVLANENGTTKDTIIAAERVSRRVGVGSGLIGYGILRATELAPNNAIVEKSVELAQKPTTWFALGALLYAPSALQAGKKSIKNKIQNRRNEKKAY